MTRAALAAAGAFVLWLISTDFAKATARLAPDHVRAMIERINREEFGGWFDPADVMAIVEIESGFNPGAYRHEPRLDDASIGLMQVLSSTARDRGYQGKVAGLFDPEANLRVGMRHLKWTHDFLSARMGGRVEKATWIGAYNGGVGNALKGWVPLDYWARFQAARDRYA